MKIFTRCKNTNSQVNDGPREGRAPALNSNTRKTSQAGNVFFALFAAVAMVGAVGFSFNSVIKGPIASMTEATKKTLAENTVLTSSRVAVVSATTQQPLTVNGDCDADGYVEPMPFRDAGAGPKPTGGGYMPTGMMPSTLDPWNSEYGYCAWDSGTVRTLCGGAAGRLVGSPTGNQYSIAIISAGKDKIFQTTCNAYVDTTPADGKPDVQMLVRAPASDDIVLGYTYAEANDLGNGLWKIKTTDANVAQTNKNLDVTGGGKFSQKVELTGNTVTGGGLILPGDPGDNSLTGPCNTANDKQLRRNTSTTPPKIEICDFVGGLGWNQITGGGASPGTTTGSLISHWKFNETSGTTALDSISGLNGTLLNGPTWDTDSILSGSVYLSGATNESVRVDQHAKLEPTAFSIALWFKADGTQPDTASRLMSKFNQDVGANAWSLHFTNNNATTIEFGTRNLPNTVDVVTSPLTLSNGTWYHAVAVYDPAGPAPQKRLYIDGALSQSKTLTTGIYYGATNALSRLYIGNSAGNNRFKGRIDDARFYNYGLSDAEVTKLYQLGVPKFNAGTTKKAGRIFGWGADGSGRLGNGADNAAHSPSPSASNSSFVQTEASDTAGCGLHQDGTVWCWGADTYGVIGNGPLVTAVQQVPVKVDNLTNIVKISVATEHACALKKDGTLWCWGTNTSGGLGNGTTTLQESPVRAAAAFNDFIDVSVGATVALGYSCGVRRNGEAWCWGEGSNGQLGNGATADSSVPVKVSTISNFVSISANKSGSNVCGITKDGRGYCWGTQANGQFGNGVTAGTSSSPTQISNLTDLVKISTYGSTACALRGIGEIWCTGRDNVGQLGNGLPLTNVNVYGQVPGFSDWIDVSVGLTSACGVRKNGEAWCWGSDSSYQLGNGDVVTADQPSPVRVLGSNFIQISVGEASVLTLVDETVNAAPPINIYQGKIASSSQHACMIQDDGTMWCWGQDLFGQLGNGPALTANQESPTRVSDPGPWIQVGAGTQNTCGLKADGTLWCWGGDGYGELGNGAGGSSDVPVLAGSSTDRWTKISIGNYTGCGIKTDGTAWCWGSGGNGELGNGATGSNQPSPVQVLGGGTWTDISTSWPITCGVKSDGSGWCWGSDSNGKLGNGGVLTADQSSPSAVDEPGPWRQISAGSGSGPTCGIKVNGSLWCWGNDGNGQIGNGADTTNDRVSPTLVSDAGPFVYVSPFVSTVALKADGTAVSWGQKLNGALGQGDTTSVPTSIPAPAPVVGGIKFAAISSGNSVCGLSFEGKAYCWGADTNGRLGNGSAVTAAQGQPYPVDFSPSKAPFIWSDLGTGFTAQGNIAIGTTLLTDTEGGTSGLSFPGSGTSLLRQSSTANQFMLEGIDTATTAFGYGAQIALGIKQPTSAGLVGHWKFDDTNAPLYNSVTGAADVGTETGTSFISSGQINGARSFSGANQTGLTIPNVSSSADGTISFWFKANGTWDTDGSIASDHAVLFNQTNPNSGVHMMVTPAGLFQFGLTSNGSYTCVGARSLPTYLDNRWHHVVIPYSPNNTTNTVYFDGAASLLTCNRTVQWTSMDTGVSIGYIPSNTVMEEFKGQMDDFRIYDRQLSAGEITAMYNAGNVPVQARMFGLATASGSLEFARSQDATWLNDVMPDMEVSNTGFVGIGTGGSPGAALDVRGGIKIGNNAGGCTASNAGEIKYTAGVFSYCAGAGGWTALASAGGGTAPWDAKRGSMATGRNHSCALKADGTARCWGRGDQDGRLGNNQSVANSLVSAIVHDSASPTGWTDWVKIAAGEAKTCGIRANGEAWCWGSNALGSNSWNNAPGQTRPVKVHDETTATGWTDWVDISVGINACGIRSNGRAYCWGSDYLGRSGNGALGDTLRPSEVNTDVGTPGWTDWKMIRTMYNHTCGIRADGSAWCWGWNASGQLGNATNTDSQRPVQVRAMEDLGAPWTDWVDIDVGYDHTCGVRANGELYCWGNDGSGQLGFDSAVPLDGGITPHEVFTDTGSSAGWSDWIGTTLGNMYTCGIRANGSAYCWGNYFSGNLGAGNVSFMSEWDRPMLVQTNTGPGGWSDWVDISAEYGATTCGLRANGTAWCWGAALYGTLGNNTTTPNQSRPVQVQ